MSPPDATAERSWSDPGLGYGELARGSALRRRLRSSPILQGLFALLLYAAAWLPTVARPLVQHFRRAQLLISSPDPNFYIWSLHWWPYAVRNGLNPLYSHLIAAPAGHSLAWATTIPPLAFLSAPITLTSGPVVAFNLLTALAAPLSGWAAFAASRRLTGKFWPALVGGAVYGFSAYEIGSLGAGQLNLCYALLPPLLVYLVVAWWDGSIGRVALVVLAGLLLAVQFYLFLETFADVTGLTVLSLLFGVAVAGRDGRRKALRLAGLLGLAYGAALALATPYLLDVLSTPAPARPAPGSLDLASLVLPRPGRSLGIGWLARLEAEPHAVSNMCSVGIPLLIVVIALVIAGRRNRLVWLLTGLFVVITVGALGPELRIAGTQVAVMPWHALFGLPFVKNAYPARLMLFAYLILALGTALLLAGVADWHAPEGWRARASVAGRWCIGVLVVAFGVLNASAPLVVTAQTMVPAFISSGQYRNELSPGENVLVVSKVRDGGMLWQAMSGFYWRLVGGFINEGFEHRTDLPIQAQQLQWATPSRVTEFESLVRTDRIGAILVDSREAPPWVGIFPLLGLTGLRAGGVIVYPTDNCQYCRPVRWEQIVAAHTRPETS